MENKINTIWDWLDHIKLHKTPSSEFTEEDWSKFTTWTIHKSLSLDPNFINFVEFVQGISPEKKREIYEIYREFIPKGKSWNKFIKSKTKPINKGLLEYIAKYFGCSSREAKDYYRILGKEKCREILEDFGLEDKEIKKQKLL